MALIQTHNRQKLQVHYTIFGLQSGMYTPNVFRRYTKHNGMLFGVTTFILYH